MVHCVVRELSGTLCSERVKWYITLTFSGLLYQALVTVSPI